MSILTGIFNPNSFDADTHVFLENESIYPKYSNNARKFIGSCPQFDVLFENLTVYEHLVWIYRLKGETNQLSIENHINTLLNDLGKQMFILELVDMKWRKVSALSGGNKRKVSLACACLGNPKIIFLGIY